MRFLNHKPIKSKKHLNFKNSRDKKARKKYDIYTRKNNSREAYATN